MGFTDDSKRIVSEKLAQPAQDNTGPRYEKRIGRYFEEYMVNVFPDMAVQALEGSIFTANNSQTGIATAAAPTAFSAVNPFLLVYNRDSTTNATAMRIIMDYITLIATAAGTAGASVQFAIVLDYGSRYTSGGTLLTPVNPNGDISNASVAQIYAGNIVCAAASAAARTIVGQRYMKGAIPVAGDTYMVKCGGVDAPSNLSIATLTFSTNNVPKIIIPPGWTMTLHLWLPSQSAASSYAPELTWVER